MVCRAKGRNGEGFLAVIFPRKAGEPEPVIEPWADGAGAKIAWKGETHFILLDTKEREVNADGINGFARVRCPKCGTTMRIVAFIERHQTEVIRRRASSYGGTSREDSQALWTLGRALSSRPALGEDVGYGLRLRAKGTGGAVAPRARRGIGSTVNYTREGRCPLRFQAR